MAAWLKMPLGTEYENNQAPPVYELPVNHSPVAPPQTLSLPQPVTSARGDRWTGQVIPRREGLPAANSREETESRTQEEEYLPVNPVPGVWEEEVAMQDNQVAPETVTSLQ